MSTFSVSSQGIDALRALASGLIDSLESVEGAASKLDSAASEQSGLGPHADQIDEIITNIRTAVNSAKGPVEDLSQKVSEVADAYQDIIDTNLFSGIS